MFQDKQDALGWTLKNKELILYRIDINLGTAAIYSIEKIALINCYS